MVHILDATLLLVVQLVFAVLGVFVACADCLGNVTESRSNSVLCNIRSRFLWTESAVRHWKRNCAQKLPVNVHVRISPPGVIHHSRM